MPNPTVVNDAALTVPANKLALANHRLGERLATISANADAEFSASNGAYEGASAARKARDDAVRVRDGYRRRAEQAGQPVDPDEDVLNEAAVARATAAQERASANSSKVQARSANASQVHRKTTAYLNQLGAVHTFSEPQQGPIFTQGIAHTDTAITIIEPKAFKGDIDEALSKVDAAIKATERAPVPAEEAKAALIADLDRHGASAKPEASFGKRPTLHWPVTRVAAEAASAGTVPVAPDVLPWLVRFHRAELIKDIEQLVAEKYEGVELALSDKDKRTALAKLKAERLDLDRIRCARIWEDYETSQTASLDFPRDADPRAILGIDGPEPQPLRA